MVGLVMSIGESIKSVSYDFTGWTFDDYWDGDGPFKYSTIVANVTSWRTYKRCLKLYASWKKTNKYFKL